jgi:hypothetical protein
MKSKILMGLFLSLFFLIGNASLFAAHEQGNPPGPAGGPGAGEKFHHKREMAKQRWEGMSPSQKYEHATRKLERLKAKRAKMAEKGVSEAALKQMDKRITWWQNRIDKHPAQPKESKKS